MWDGVELEGVDDGAKKECMSYQRRRNDERVCRVV